MAAKKKPTNKKTTNKPTRGQAAEAKRMTAYGEAYAKRYLHVFDQLKGVAKNQPGVKITYGTGSVPREENLRKFVSDRNKRKVGPQNVDKGMKPNKKKK